MRQCKCGGLVRVANLTTKQALRESWSCESCDRYEIHEKSIPEPVEEQAEEKK